MRHLAVVPTVLLLATLAPTTAASGPPTVLINEIFYDAEGADGPHVFTELWGAGGRSLDGLFLVAIDGNDGDVYREVDLAGLVLPDDGHLVLVTDGATCNARAAADHVAPVDWQNGPDAVKLVHRTARTELVLDAVGYGDAPFFAGEGTPAPDPNNGLAITRDADHTDTGDNGADLVAARPTPGLAAATDEELADPDDDCYANAWDNCPLTTNPDQADADGNGVGDACEAQVPVAEWGTLRLTLAGTVVAAAALVRRRR